MHKNTTVYEYEYFSLYTHPFITNFQELKTSKRTQSTMSSLWPLLYF